MLIYRNEGNAALDEMEMWDMNAAPQYEPEVEAEPELIIEEPVEEPISKRQKVKILTRILMLSVLAFFLITRFAVVSQANLRMLDVKSAIKKQEIKNGDMEAKLTDSIDFTTVQEKAAALGMDFPENDQVQNMSVIPYEDIVKAHKQSEKEKREIGIVWSVKE